MEPTPSLLIAGTNDIVRTYPNQNPWLHQVQRSNPAPHLGRDLIQTHGQKQEKVLPRPSTAEIKCRHGGDTCNNLSLPLPMPISLYIVVVLVVAVPNLDT